MERKNKVLVVVDMQNDFIDGSLGTKEAQAIVNNAVEEIKNFKGFVFVTFDTHEENYLETSEGKKLPVKHCIKGTQGWGLNEKIHDALSSQGTIFRSVLKGTFGSVDLPEKIVGMRGNDQSQLEITLIGLCTDICVVSNALLLKAHFPEADISVKANCCAGVTPESHEAALKTMEMCQINIIR